jgi:hypothetical protein
MGLIVKSWKIDISQFFAYAKVKESDDIIRNSRKIDVTKNLNENNNAVIIHQEKELVVENLCPNCENTNDEGSIPTKIGNTLNVL